MADKKAAGKKLYDAILAGDSDDSVAATKEAIAAGVAPLAIIAEFMVPAMAEVGKLFEAEEYFVPELLLTGRAMKAGVEILRPLLAAAGEKPSGVAIVGTVHGDVHDIGKNLVVALLEGGGYEVHDLGNDVAPEKFVSAIREFKANIVGMSAMLTVSMPAMKTTMDAINAAGVRKQVIILVGGAPLDARYANEIGADAYGESAVDAVKIVNKLIGKVA
jgi:5-methyltetrahydrofolate--homocysteine methyltransferase